MVRFFKGDKMSIERHPNFHAVKFVTDLIVAFSEAATRAEVPIALTEEMKELIVNFVVALEALVDEQVAKF